MTKVLVCPSAYKGSLKPSAVAAAMVRALNRGDFEVDVAPVADGGDGTVEALHDALGGQIHWLEVLGPVGAPVLAGWLERDGLAVAELASASGIAYLGRDELDPLGAHTYGLGQVIAAIAETSIDDLVVTVGGSASTDGGTGALAALGAAFYDGLGVELPLGGGALTRLARVDLSGLPGRLSAMRLRVASDVTNPLTGPSGAASVFAPQKGASAEEVARLEAGLTRLADVLEAATGRSLRQLPGAGAAGGCAFGLCAALSAELIPGFRWLSSLIGLADKIAWADIVVTGEGRLDSQSLAGKAAGELAELSRRLGKRLWAFPAVCQAGVDWAAHGFERVITTAGPDGLADERSLEAAVASAFLSAGA